MDCGKERTFRRWLWGIVIVAFLLRLGVSRELAAINGGANSVFSPPGTTDPATYMELARRIAEGNFHEAFYYQPFYYAVFLPVVRWLSGGSVWGVIAAQSLLGALTVYLTGLIAARLGGRGAGLAAAGLTAVSTPLLLYTPYHLIATLQTFNLTLLGYLALMVLIRRRLCGFFCCGAVAGIGILTRGNIYLLVPGLLIAGFLGCLRPAAGGWKRGIAGCLLLLAGVLAVQLPFVIHNTRICGRLTGPSTAASAVLALGNTPEAPPGGRNVGLPAGPMEYPDAYRIFMERDGVRPVPLQILDWMREEPGAFAELTFRKLLLFWEYGEIPNNVSLYGEGRSSRILRWTPFGRSGLLLALGLAGMLLLASKVRRRRDWKLGMLYYLVLFYWGSIAMFYILSRFRAPVLPLVAVFAGLFLAELRRRLRRRRREELLSAGLALAVGGFIVFGANDFYRDYLESAAIRLVRPEGVRLRDGGALVRFDHGPYSFGGWHLGTSEPLRKGDRIQKRFAGMPEGTVAARLKMTFFRQAAGRDLLRVNGRTVWLDLNERGEMELPVEVRNGEVTLDVLAVGSDGLSAVLDGRRDYGRSFFNGERTGGEWVMRIFYPENFH